MIRHQELLIDDQDVLKDDQEVLKDDQDVLKRDQDVLKKEQEALKDDQDVLNVAMVLDLGGAPRVVVTAAKLTFHRFDPCIRLSFAGRGAMAEVRRSWDINQRYVALTK